MSWKNNNNDLYIPAVYAGVNMQQRWRHPFDVNIFERSFN